MIDKGLFSIVAGSLRCGVALSSLLLSAPAIAQIEKATEQPHNPEILAVSRPGDAAIGGEDPIIVTGTLVRGIAPAGADVIVVKRADVAETGVSTTAQLLQTIPQLGSFNSLQYPAGGGNQVTVNRPNLRSLPNFLSSGSATTLVLLNGHRIVGMGVQTTSPDPDIVPPGIIERVEIVPDGGSSIYGSDALAGVMNFVTRKDFKGLELDGRIGFAGNYRTFDANATAGKNWSSGSAYISYNYSSHDAVFGRDRDYIRQYPFAIAGVPFPVTGIRCSPGNVQLIPAGTIYALPYSSATARAGSANQCDESDSLSLYPEEHHHSVFAGATQELSGTVTLELSGFYMNREIDQSTGRNLSSQFLGPAFIGPFPTGLTTDSPFRQANLVTGNPLEIHQVSFAWGDRATNISNSLKTWGITPQITFDLGGGWQLRVTNSYSESRTEVRTLTYSATPLGNAINAGLFNPYDPGASDPRALAAIDNDEIFGLSRQRQLDARLVADGDLGAFPGGPAKLAVGVEYLRERLVSQKGRAIPGFQDRGFGGLSLPANLPGNPLALIQPPLSPLAKVKLGRHNEAMFGELVVPIFGKGNRRPAMEELILSAAGRYDHYSDVGGTFNPRFGVTYRPLDWIKLRASWGRSFVAPSLADDAEADITSFNWVTGPALAVLTPPSDLVANGTWPAPAPGQNFVAVLLGSAPGLRPQKAQTLSAGIDIEPPFARGLSLGVTYWRIKNRGAIANPTPNNQRLIWGPLGKLVTVNPTQAQIDALLAISDIIANTPCAPQPRCLYAIIDARKRNFGTDLLNGLDFTGKYQSATSFGSIDFAIDASYALHTRIRPTDEVPFFDILAANANRFKMRASAGARIGRMRVQAVLNHSGGYKLQPAVGLPPQQTRVGAFDVVNLFFRYDTTSTGAFKGLSLTLNVDNVFNRDPPELRLSGFGQITGGVANGLGLGRLVQLGVRKAF